MTRAPQPFRTVGRGNPLWILQYDKRGASRSPETLEQARAAVRSGDFTDVFVFSHGWNNDWKAATHRYNGFVDGFIAQRADDPDRRALLLGIFWPSALLVMPGEREPVFAAAVGDEPREPESDDLADIVEELDRDAAARVRELAARRALDERGAEELAALLAPVYRSDGPELGEDGTPPAAPQLAESWLSGTAPVAPQPPPAAAQAGGEDDDDFGVVAGRQAGPQAAGLLDAFNPRNAIRAASVWLMKDRAGRVGAEAVGPLVREALVESEARVHLVGHSFGAKVALSALCSRPVARPVHSVLLLQPAVNHLCFAEAGGGQAAGGYRTALDRVERPVFSTYSAHDAPLTRFFHWALRRSGDLREPLPAAWPEPPSPYAALGGFGPHGADGDTQRIPLKEPGRAYTLDPAKRLVAVDGTRSIKSHGAVSVPSTWWALRQLIDA
jgi:hypothetical protein